MRILPAVAGWLTLAFVCSLWANDEPQNFIVEDTPLDDWVPYQYSITEARLAKSSDWNPLKDKDNPISDKKAVQIAQASLKRYVEDMDDYELSGLELKSEDVVIDQDKNYDKRWYWIVSFWNTAVPAIGGVPLTTKIVVLLDGFTPEMRVLEGEEKELVETDFKRSQQAGTGQPATRPESKSECSDKAQPEAEGRSR